MIKKISSFVRLSNFRKVLAMQALVVSFYTYILFAFFNKHARFGEKTKTQEADQIPDEKVDDIAWVIKMIDRYIPWKNVCRHQAYQAKIFCNLYKIPCLIFIGFKKDIEKNEIQAHAWTIAGQKIITGFCNPKEYIVQSVYRNKWQ